MVFAVSFAKLAVLAFLLAIGPASAHHGWGAYDPINRIVVQGQIMEVDFGYPHVTIDVMDGNKQWHVILAPPSRMENRGLTEEELSLGLPVVVVGHPSIQVYGEMRAEHIMLNGRTVQMR